MAEVMRLAYPELHQPRQSVLHYYVPLAVLSEVSTPLSPNPPKGYGGGVDTGDDGYGKANGPGPVPIDGVEGSARWPR